MKKLLFIFLIIVFTLNHNNIQAQDTPDIFIGVAPPVDYPLYVGCQNYLNIFFGKKMKKSKLETDNGEIKILDKNKVIVIPEKMGDLTFFIKNKKGKILTQKTFKVLRIPPPKMILTSNLGTEINPETPLPKETNKVKINPKADLNFKMMVPEDAKYTIESMEIRVFRGGRVISNVLQENSDTIDLEKLKLKGNEGVQIKILKVLRTSSIGNLESARPANTFVSFYVK